VSLREGRDIESDTVIGLLPIVTGRLTSAIASRLVRTLLDPERFWTPYPAPSVAASDADFDPVRMWRGPSWLFIDYLLVDGLRRSGAHAAAEQLRARTLHTVAQGHGMPEFYHPLTGARPDMATATFSATAALYLDLALAASAEPGSTGPAQAPLPPAQP
jgi:glycogen debranching enzyme